MLPPIPAPTGAPNPSTKANRVAPSEGVAVYFRLNLGGALRVTIKEMVVAPACIFAIIFFSSVPTLMLFPIFHTVTFFQLWVLFLCSDVPVSFFIALIVTLSTRRSKKRHVLTRYGILRIERTKDIEIEWSRVLYILNWSGDLFLCTFAGSTFVPRGAFASLEERREFVQIARELHKNRGAAWRAEWNGKTFGQNS